MALSSIIIPSVIIAFIIKKHTISNNKNSFVDKYIEYVKKVTNNKHKKDNVTSHVSVKWYLSWDVQDVIGNVRNANGNAKCGFKFYFIFLHLLTQFKRNCSNKCRKIKFPLDWVNVFPRNKTTLDTYVVQRWEECRGETQYFRNLYDSMPRRLRAVVDSNGAICKYWKSLIFITFMFWNK